MILTHHPNLVLNLCVWSKVFHFLKRTFDLVSQNVFWLYVDCILVEEQFCLNNITIK